MDANIKIKSEILHEVNSYLKNNEIDKVINILENVKGYFKDDPDIFATLAKIYVLKEEYQKAYDILIDQKLACFPVFEELSKLYIKLREYDALYDLYNRYARFVIKTASGTKKEYIEKLLRRLQIFLRQYHKEIPLPKELDYKEKIYANYDYHFALEHIIYRHTKVNRNKHKDNPSIFNDSIDLEKLFIAVSKNLSLENRYNTDSHAFSDTYLVYFPNIGVRNGSLIDYFLAATIPNTNKIITMYPRFEENRPFLTLPNDVYKIVISPAFNSESLGKFKIKNYKPKEKIKLLQ